MDTRLNGTDRDLKKKRQRELSSGVEVDGVGIQLPRGRGAKSFSSDFHGVTISQSSSYLCGHSFTVSFVGPSFFNCLLILVSPGFHLHTGYLPLNNHRHFKSNTTELIFFPTPYFVFFQFSETCLTNLIHSPQELSGFRGEETEAQFKQLVQFLVLLQVSGLRFEPKPD